MEIVAILVVLVAAGVLLFVMAWRNGTWRKGVDLATKVATVMGLAGLLVGVGYTALQYRLAERMAKGEIERFTAEQIEEIRRETKKQRDDLLAVSKKAELLIEGNSFLDAEQYREATICFEEALTLDPSNELVIGFIGLSKTMEAVQAGWHNDTEKKTIAATEAKEAFQRLAEMKGEAEVAVNLAQAYMLLGDQENCKKYLYLAEEAGTLPSKYNIDSVGIFQPVRGMKWFRDLKWSGP